MCIPIDKYDLYGGNVEGTIEGNGFPPLGERVNRALSWSPSLVHFTSEERFVWIYPLVNKLLLSSVDNCLPLEVFTLMGGFR